VIDYWVTQFTAHPVVCISICLLVWMIVYQKTGLFVHKWTRTHLWLSLGDEKWAFGIHILVKCLQHSWDPWFFTWSKLQTGRSKPGIAVIPHIHSSSSKIRNCLPRRMTVDKTYWSYTVWFSVFKAYTVSVRKSSHLYSVDSSCTEASQLFALDRPLLQSRKISLRGHGSVPCQVACIKCLSLCLSLSL